MTLSRVPLIRPPVAFDDVEESLRAVFESGIFTRGEYVENFRAEVAKATTATYAHLTTSATTALSAALRVLGIRPGDEVAVADFSFPATSNAVEEVGATPVFVDVSPETFNMRIDALEAAISDRTRAVIFVSTFGNPTGLHAIRDLCRGKGLPIIDDAACAIGSHERGARSGKIADLSCFSFHPRKVITTGEGGAITTERKEWSDRLGRMLNHGAVVENGRWEFVEPGTNLRLTEFQAAIGIHQLRRLDAIVAERNRIAGEYRKALAPLGFRAQTYASDAGGNSQSVVFRVPEPGMRDRLIAHLKGAKIESTLGTYCLSGTAFNRKRYGKVCPNAESLEKETITLPCYEGMPLDRVLSGIQSFF
ncbi:MAG: DegT/DnrJ/EryC1/StrS family aminotransferase [Bdellovibrionales bacterium]|nr:DegT/DnrJ/EryC1/StrS family aminotransferase [Bdellovibrionales bacterium]